MGWARRVPIVFGIPAETLWTGAVAVVVALLGSGALVAWLNRSKTDAEAHLTDAQRQQLQDDIADGLRRDLLDADKHCDERIKLLEAARELDRQQCDAKLAAMLRRIEELEAWGKAREVEHCDRTQRLEKKVSELETLLADSEAEKMAIIEDMRREYES